MKSRPIMIAGGLVWMFVVVVGLRVLLAYENTPGVAASPSVQWPANSRIERASSRATLVMLAHPRCPCTRATIGELNTLMARCQGKVKAYVLFFRPKGAAAGWENTDLWQSADSIPGVQAVADEGGMEARRFQGQTSGQTLLFNSAGHLLFSGGITGARGHAGDNAGRDAIVSLLNDGKTAQQTAQHEAFVFGCSLRDPASVREGVK